MKYGAHVFLWQDRYDDSALLRMLDDAEAWGLSFLEVAIGDDIHFNASKLGDEADMRGLELVFSPGGAWPMECDISLANASDPHPAVQWHRRAIEQAGRAGAVAYTGAIYGHPGAVRKQRPDEDEPKRIAESLNQLAEDAADAGVQLVLEPMSHFRTHVANTPQQVNLLIALADHENLFSLFDTYHLVTEVTDFAAAFEEMRPHLWGLHACENNRGAPGTGLLPWQSLFTTMSAANWQGYIGFESYNSTWRDGDFALERGMFHNVCPDAESFIRHSKSFVEAGLSAAD